MLPLTASDSGCALAPVRDEQLLRDKASAQSCNDGENVVITGCAKASRAVNV